MVELLVLKKNRCIRKEKLHLFPPPTGSGKSTIKSEKTDALERIVEKVNEKYQDDFSPADKVALDSVFQMLMGDLVVKKRLTEYAKTNDD